MHSFKWCPIPQFTLASFTFTIKVQLLRHRMKNRSSRGSKTFTFAGFEKLWHLQVWIRVIHGDFSQEDSANVRLLPLRGPWWKNISEDWHCTFSNVIYFYVKSRKIQWTLGNHIIWSLTTSLWSYGTRPPQQGAFLLFLHCNRCNSLQYHYSLFSTQIHHIPVISLYFISREFSML